MVTTGSCGVGAGRAAAADPESNDAARRNAVQSAPRPLLGAALRACLAAGWIIARSSRACQALHYVENVHIATNTLVAWTSALRRRALRRPPDLIDERAVGQRLGEVHAAHFLDTVEIGERARHPQHAMIARRGAPA